MARHMRNKSASIVSKNLSAPRKEEDVLSKKLIFSVTIKDCEVDYIRGSGAGGTKRNKTHSGVRVRHKPSGSIGQATETRSQLENKQLAFSRMANTKTFQTWCRVKALNLEPLEDIVNKLMAEENIKIEYGPFK